MKESPMLMGMAAAHEGSCYGTPAGNSRFSQEQHAWLRKYCVRMENISAIKVLVPRWARMKEIPPAMLSQNAAVEVEALVIGVGLVLLPSGAEVKCDGARLS